MKCEEALLLISGHLDHANTIEEEAALQAHLSTCSACRDVLQAFEYADQGIADLQEKAPEDLCDRVMEQISQPKKKKHLRPWLGVVAAALLLVVGVSATVDLQEENIVPQTATVSEAYSVQRSVVQVDADALAQQISRERDAVVAVVREMYYEIETYPCETLEEGGVLYALPDHNAAVLLHETYGCAIYEPNENSDTAYALLVP
ncbi:MAG: zf-HC2 domain-containing protein [Oscillospiraceae bacterium]|nr:zf-HC2 domain-containing protein [Oscillospiraceae bacterium]